MGVRIVVDQNGCIGSGECVSVDPEAMEIDSTGTAAFLLDEIDAERAERICRSCPVNALSIEA